MALKKIAGPAFLATAAANIYTPPAATIYTVIRHIHIANEGVVAATFSLWVGLTGGSAAGTALFKAYPIAASGSFDYFCAMKLTSADFLTGLSNTLSALTITIEGDQEVV